MTVSPRLFISVIENVSNVAKLTKSNSFDQKMNLARLSVSGCPTRREGNKQNRETENKTEGEGERDYLTSDHGRERRETGSEG